MSFDVSKLFFAVVNSTRDHTIIDDVSKGTVQQQITALQYLLLSPETPHYLLPIIQSGYNMLVTGQYNFRSIYTPESYLDITDYESVDIAPETRPRETKKPEHVFDPIKQSTARYDPIITNSKVYVGD
jgi:hypothetical protein